MVVDLVAVEPACGYLWRCIPGIFSSGGGAGGRTRAAKGADLRYNLELDLEDAVKAKRKNQSAIPR